MTTTISLREANQGFSRVVRDVEAGADFLITRNGVPVARLVPASGTRVLTPTQQAAFARTLERMGRGQHILDEPFDRDALHER